MMVEPHFSIGGGSTQKGVESTPAEGWSLLLQKGGVYSCRRVESNPAPARGRSLTLEKVGVLTCISVEFNPNRGKGVYFVNLKVWRRRKLEPDRPIRVPCGKES